jgi:ketosteroid isomerase-like protein
MLICGASEEDASMAHSSLEIAQAFVKAVNAADLPAMRALMTEDHTFTDALGRSTSGVEKMIVGWRYFFEAFPEYWIRVDKVIADGSLVALFGEAGGNWRIDGQVLPHSWSVRAAWLGEIEAGKVKTWSVCCDTGWAKPPAKEEI